MPGYFRPLPPGTPPKLIAACVRSLAAAVRHNPALVYREDDFHADLLAIADALSPPDNPSAPPPATPHPACGV